MNLSSYFDYYDWDLNKQITLFKFHELDYFILRKISNTSFLNFHNKEEVLQKLRRIKVGLFDPLLKPIHTDDAQSVKDLEEASEFARKLKTKNIIIKIKHFDKDSVTVSELNNYFKEIFKVTKRLNLIIKVDNINDIYIYNMIANELKLRRVTLIYNPALIYQKDYSPVTAYRLFKAKTGLVEVADISDEMVAMPLGFGVLDLIELFKKMFRDKYRGLVALNSNLDETFKYFGVEESQVDRKHKRANTKKYLEVITRLGYISHETKEEIPFEEVLEHQIKLLRIVFK